MKNAAVLAASVAAAAASSIALASLSIDKGLGGESGKEAGSRREGEKNKFAPRFDGLRFIETLVTAHR